MTEQKLQPCPFCGHIVNANKFLQIAPGPIQPRQTYCVKCLLCGVRGPWAFEEKQAIELWNKRNL
jgi:Lar family restriction alleviation protein